MSNPNPAIRQIFDAVMELESLEDREILIEQLCGKDDALRNRVRTLVAAHASATGFLEAPLVALTGLEPAATELEQVGGELGTYRLQELIGEGGFGQVFVAEQLAPVRRQVALKIIKPGMDSREVIARFEIERQALALMDHPNIARVLDAGMTPAGRSYFVMELVRGVPITQYCDEHLLAPRERMELFISVCHAIQHAHQKGIVHRDIKPSNVLVATHDGKPVPKVIDFGVAKAIEQQCIDATVFTRFQQMLGTPLYMSPEQAESNSSAVDTRSDIYSLGVLLYELITGSTPFDRKRFSRVAMDEIRKIIREEEPPCPSARLSGSGDQIPKIASHRKTEPIRLSRFVRGDLDWIVMKAMEKDRARRYSTAESLAQDVLRFLDHQPVLAGPPTVRYRFGKFLRRHRGGVFFGGVLLLSLIIGIIGTSIGLIQSNRHMVRAVAAESRAIEEMNKSNAAANTERTANEKAQKRLAQVEVGNEILGSIFHDLDPNTDESQDEPLIARLGKRLDSAVAQLDADSIGDPLTVARMQRTLGESLRGLGYPQKAIPILLNSRETLTKMFGSDHAETRETVRILGLAYQQNQQNLDALPLLKSTFEWNRNQLGSDDSETLDAMYDLARNYQDSGDIVNAVSLYEDAWNRASTFLALDHDVTLNLMKGLAEAYRMHGDLDQATEFAEKSYRAGQRKFGAEHSFTISAANALAAAYRRAGKTNLAIPLLEETLRLRRKTLGSDHPRTLVSMNNLAVGYLEAGQNELAAQLWNEALRLEQIRLAPNHPTRLATLNGLANCYQMTKQFDLALPLFEEALDLLKKTLGPAHPNTLITTNNFAGCLKAMGQVDRAIPLLQGAAEEIERIQFRHEYADRIVGSLCESLELANKFDQAEPWRRKWLEAVKENSGSDTSPFALELAALGWDLAQQAKWIEAEAALRDSLRIRERLEPTAWTTTLVQFRLAIILIGKGEFADAEPNLERSFAELMERKSQIPESSMIHLTNSLDLVGKLLSASDHQEGAAKWNQRRQQLAKPND